METEQVTYKQIIRDELHRRKYVNKAYSLRSYARDISISPSRLSEILANKGGLSLKKAKQIGMAIGFRDSELQYFLALVINEESEDLLDVENAKHVIKDFLASKEYSPLSNEIFHVISDWYYFAILTVMELDAFDGTILWISNRLGLDLDVTKSAIETMEKVNLITRRSSRLVATQINLSTTTDIPSSALKKSHIQTLEQAQEAIMAVNVKDRDITSITMAIDKEKIPLAKEKIKSFRREMSAFLEEGNKNAVYNLNIQLHPLTQ